MIRKSPAHLSTSLYTSAMAFPPNPFQFLPPSRHEPTSHGEVWIMIWGSAAHGHCQCCGVIITPQQCVPVKRECWATLCQNCNQHLGQRTFAQFARTYPSIIGEPMDLS